MHKLFVKFRLLSAYWQDVAWQASGNTLAQVVAVLAVPLLTRLYTPTDFAIQSLFIQVVTFLTAIVTWRYEYFVLLPKDDAEAAALNSLVLTLGFLTTAIITPIIWLYREPLALQLGEQSVAPWLVLVTPTAVLMSWAIAIQNNAQRHGDFRSSGLSELVRKISYVLTGIFGAFAKQGPAGLVLATGFGAVGKGLFILSRRTTWRDSLLNRDGAVIRLIGQRYRRLATSTVFSHLLTTSAIAIPQIALARLYGAEVLGQFALVLATIYLPSAVLGAAVGQVYYQRAARFWAEGRVFYPLWKNTAKRLFLIGVPVYVLVTILARVAYPLVFGEQWELAGEFATWMAVAAFASFISAPMDRTGLVVGAWQYPILWSAYRTASVLVVIWLAWELNFTPMQFVVAIVVQMCTAYGIDFWMGRKFSQGRLGIFSSSIR